MIRTHASCLCRGHEFPFNVLYYYSNCESHVADRLTLIHVCFTTDKRIQGEENKWCSNHILFTKGSWLNSYVLFVILWCFGQIATHKPGRDETFLTADVLFVKSLGGNVPHVCCPWTHSQFVWLLVGNGPHKNMEFSKWQSFMQFVWLSREDSGLLGGKED